MPGCAGGSCREGRGFPEPDARAWCRWRRGQSRHHTLIFDLATGRCIAARCPPGPSASPGSGISRSGARGDELLSAPPGSPALLLPPLLLLLPPSLRQSSGGSWSRRPRPTAEGGAAPRHRHAASGPGVRGSLTCGRCRRPALDLGTRPSGQHAGVGERVPGSASRASTGLEGGRLLGPIPAPTRNRGPWAAGDTTRQVASPWDEGIVV